MRGAIAAALTALLGACATPAAHGDAGALFTRTALANSTTADLARLFLDPADAAIVERHEMEENHSYIGDNSWSIFFVARDRPVGTDICERTSFLLNFVPAKHSRRDANSREIPAQHDRVYRSSRFALAPGCRDLPGRSFASKNWFGDNAISDQEAIAILRRLAAAQAAAAGTEPLPFRLSCLNASHHWDFECPMDLRPVLAALPLHQAFTIERHPFPNNCNWSSRDESDAIEVGEPQKGEIWDVRLRNMGTAQASILLIRQFSRTHVKC